VSLQEVVLHGLLAPPADAANGAGGDAVMAGTATPGGGGGGGGDALMRTASGASAGSAGGARLSPALRPSCRCAAPRRAARLDQGPAGTAPPAAPCRLLNCSASLQIGSPLGASASNVAAPFHVEVLGHSTPRPTPPHPLPLRARPCSSKSRARPVAVVHRLALYDDQEAIVNIISQTDIVRCGGTGWGRDGVGLKRDRGGAHGRAPHAERPSTRASLCKPGSCDARQVPPCLWAPSRCFR
jgi:hypothetical protein